jgi:phenylalanyl-tRNA synthetase beta chain
MSEAQAIMRPTILGSLLDVAAHNVAHGMADLALFESAAVYRRLPEDPARDPHAAPADEHHALAVLLHGAPGPRAWTGEGPSPADFFAAKGVLEGVLAALRVEAAYAPAHWPFLHPGRSAEVLAADGTRLGFVGEVHPLVTRAWDLPQPAAAWAVDLGAVIARAPEVQSYQDLTSYPALTQDLAVVVPDDVPAARVVEVVRAAGGARLADVSVFDVYRGAQLGEGRTSLALHCAFRAPDRTLTDEDVAPLREKIVARLASELGGELRG